MKRHFSLLIIFITTTLVIFTVYLAIPPLPSFATEVNCSRYFYSGNGWIHLVNAKNGASFKGIYRAKGGEYDQKALNKIHEAFGAHYENPVSHISFRLIEFLDFLSDRLNPDSKITIASGWRSPEYNRGLREKGKLAAKTSLHQYGMAADIEIEGVKSKQIWDYIKGLGFGGAGYYHGNLVHVDVGPARSWDEKTSGVGTDVSDQNKLIGIVSDRDIYLPGERVTLRFIRMSAFPIGVAHTFILEPAEGEAGLCEAIQFTPQHKFHFDSECPQFNGIGEMIGFRWELPVTLPPGRYKIRASFCQPSYKGMPESVTTPAFEVRMP